MTHIHRHIAVLTGDLVGSTTLSRAQLDAAFAALEDAAEQIGAWTGDSLRLSRHRGDGWQAVLTAPEYALRAALVFRAHLKALGTPFDSYIGIAEGVQTREIGQDLNAEAGDAFIASGGALEALRQTSSPMRMGHHSQGAQNAAIILCDAIICEWTPTQAEAMALAVDPSHPRTFTKIAAHLGKSRQTITKTLRAAKFDYIEAALETADSGTRNA